MKFGRNQPRPHRRLSAPFPLHLSGPPSTPHSIAHKQLNFNLERQCVRSK